MENEYQDKEELQNEDLEILDLDDLDGADGKPRDKRRESEPKLWVTVACLILTLLVGVFLGFLLGTSTKQTSEEEPTEQTVSSGDAATEVESEEVKAEELETTDRTTDGTTEETTEANAPEQVIPAIDYTKMATDYFVASDDPRDYFLAALLEEGNDGQYRLTGTRFDALCRDYNYFDFAGFVAGCLDAKAAFLQIVGDDSVRLSAEKSPFGTPTTIIQNNMNWLMRIVGDKSVTDINDDYDDFVDVYTRLDNSGNLYTAIVVCHADSCYYHVYYGEPTPDKILMSARPNNQPNYPFIIESDALVDLLEMTEKGTLMTDENPFESIDQESDTMEDYHMFSDHK